MRYPAIPAPRSMQVAIVRPPMTIPSGRSCQYPATIVRVSHAVRMPMLPCHSQFDSWSPCSSMWIRTLMSAVQDCPAIIWMLLLEVIRIRTGFSMLHSPAFAVAQPRHACWSVLQSMARFDRGHGVVVRQTGKLPVPGRRSLPAFGMCSAGRHYCRAGAGRTSTFMPAPSSCRCSGPASGAGHPTTSDAISPITIKSSWK